MDSFISLLYVEYKCCSLWGNTRWAWLHRSWVDLTCRIAEAGDPAITMPFSTLIHKNVTIINFTILDPTDNIYSAKVCLTEEKFMMVRLAVFFFHTLTHATVSRCPIYWLHTNWNSLWQSHPSENPPSSPFEISLLYDIPFGQGPWPRWTGSCKSWLNPTWIDWLRCG